MLRMANGACYSNPASHMWHNCRLQRCQGSKIHPRRNHCCSNCQSMRDIRGRTCEPQPTKWRNKPRRGGTYTNWNGNGASGSKKRGFRKNQMQRLSRSAAINSPVRVTSWNEYSEKQVRCLPLANGLK